MHDFQYENFGARAGRLFGQQLILISGTLRYAATTTIDFNGPDVQNLALTGNVVFATKNLAPNRWLRIIITADASARTFTFPAWLFLGVAPTSIAASKTASMDLYSTGTTDAGVVAIYNEQGTPPSGAIGGSGSAYSIVGGSSSPTTNGSNLLAAYAAAKLSTPNGSALSVANRFTIFLLPGVFDLGSGALTLDTQFIDIVGLSTNTGQVASTTSSGVTNFGDTIIKSSQTLVNINLNFNAHDITIANVCLYCSDTTQAYSALTTVYTQFGTDWKMYNVLIVGLNTNSHVMPWDKSYDGTWIDVRCFSDRAFGKAVFSTLTIAGTYIRCKMGTNCVGGGEGGTALTITATYIDCEAQQNSWGRTGDTNSGKYYRCRQVVIGGGSTFMGTLSSTCLCEDCTGDPASACFGSAGTVMAGTLRRCSSAAPAFASATGKIVDCDFTSAWNLEYDRNQILGQATITYASTITFDFNGPAYQLVSLTGNLILAGTNMADGKSITIELLADSSDRSLTYDVNWVVFGTSITTVTASKRVMLTLKCNSTTAASVRVIAVSQV